VRHDLGSIDAVPPGDGPTTVTYGARARRRMAATTGLPEDGGFEVEGIDLRTPTPADAGAVSGITR